MSRALELADEYERGTAKALATGYEEFSKEFASDRSLIVAALRAYERPSDTNAPSDDWRAGVEAAAKWHEEQSAIYRNGTNSINRAIKENYILLAREHEEAARCIRALTPPTKGGA